MHESTTSRDWTKNDPYRQYVRKVTHRFSDGSIEELYELDFDPFEDDENFINIQPPTPEESSFAVDKWNYVQNEKIYDFHYTFNRIKDKVTLNAVQLFVDWKWRLDPNTKFEHKYRYFDEYWNWLIKVGKKWMNMKCVYMHELIEMYEYYYWCQYVLKDITEKVKEMNKEMDETPEFFNDHFLKDSTRFRLSLFGDDKGWDNENQKKMSVLLKKITEEYRTSQTYIGTP